MSYQLNKSHILISILAALVLATGFVAHLLGGISHNLFTMALWVSAAIVLFYCIGAFVRAFLISQVFPPPVEEEAPEAAAEIMAESGAMEADATTDVMNDDPLLADEMYVDPFDDPLMEPLAYTDAS